MSRAAWLNALLAVVVLALGTWAYLKPPKDATVAYLLSTLSPADARSIRIERAGHETIVLEKREAWRLAAPFPARADDFRVRQLLGILEARASSRTPATDLARFDLERPALRITVDKQSFEFGLVSPVTNEQYVLTGGFVYGISPRFGTTLPAVPADLASRQLFGPGETPVRFELAGFTVEQRDGKWTQTPPAAANPGQDDFIRWVEEWRGASALRVDPQRGGKPLADLRVQLKNGNTLPLGLLAREPELVLFRPDEKLQYSFRAEIGKKLLSPPVAEPEPAAKQ